jgi:hypothetical protein
MIRISAHGLVKKDWAPAGEANEPVPDEQPDPDGMVRRGPEYNSMVKPAAGNDPAAVVK